MTPAAWLEEIKERVAKASPGPWEFERIAWDRGDFSYEKNDKDSFIAIYEDNYTKRMQAKFDADLIFNSRTDIPRLIKVLEASISESQSLRSALDESDSLLDQANAKLKIATAGLIKIAEDPNYNSAFVPKLTARLTLEQMRAALRGKEEG